jgi:hypothetical protein
MYIFDCFHFLVYDLFITLTKSDSLLGPVKTRPAKPSGKLTYLDHDLNVIFRQSIEGDVIHCYFKLIPTRDRMPRTTKQGATPIFNFAGLAN